MHQLWIIAFILTVVRTSAQEITFTVTLAVVEAFQLFQRESEVSTYIVQHIPNPGFTHLAGSLFEARSIVTVPEVPNLLWTWGNLTYVFPQLPPHPHTQCSLKYAPASQREMREGNKNSCPQTYALTRGGHGAAHSPRGTLAAPPLTPTALGRLCVERCMG